MVIYYFLLILFIFQLARNFKQTLLLYLPTRIALHQGIILWPVNPTIMFDSVACFMIVIIYLSSLKHTKLSVKFPFWFPLCLYAISEFCSSFLASTSGTALNFFQNIVVGILFLYVVWYCIDSKKDLNFIIKGYTILFTIAILLSIFEQITHFNPIIRFESILLPANAPRGLIWESSTDLRIVGLFRAQAFMPISISYGAYCLMFFLFYFFITNHYPIYNYFTKVKNKMFTLGLILGVFLSGSKSPILSLFIGFFPYLKLKWIFNIKILLSFLLIISISLPLIDKLYKDIYSALTVENYYEYQGGSSLAMRKMQLEVSLKEFEKAPLIGNGTKHLAEAKSYYGSELLGAESIWFELLIEKGLLGIISFIILLIYPLFVKGIIHKKGYVALMLGWLAINTMTTIPGLGNTFYYTLIMLMYKAQLLSNSNNIKQYASLNYHSRV